MIDFSCCEVEKAFKGLFSDNEILSIKPIVKSRNQPFENVSTVVYYGAFANPSDQTVYYGGYEILQTPNDILFNRVENVAYDSFTGYEIRLKNSIQEIRIFHDTNLVGIGAFESVLAAFYANFAFNGGVYPLMKLSFENGDYVILKSSASGAQPYPFWGFPIYMGDYRDTYMRIQMLNDDLSVRGFGYSLDGGAGGPRVEHLDYKILGGNNTINIYVQENYL